MKHLVVLIAMFITLLNSNASKSEEVAFASEAINIVFEDDNLTTHEKKMFLEDVRRVLATAPSAANLKPFKKGAKRSSMEMSGRIDMGVKNHHWPRPYWKSGFGEFRVNTNTSKKELVVPVELSGALQTAADICARNQSAVDELESFLKTLEAGYDPTSMSLEEKKALFWFPPGQAAWGKESYYDDNIQEMKSVKFHAPSVLTFKEKDINGLRLFYCKPVVSGRTSDDGIDQMTLVYDGGKWRIGAF